MIEMLATALLVALIAAGMAEALIAGAGFSQDQKARTEGNALAQQDQERLKGLSDEQLAALSQARTLTLDGTAFTVKSGATFLDASGGSACTTKVAAYFRLVTTVTWSEGTASPTHTVTQSTILTRPAAGSLLVRVTDERGSYGGQTFWLPGVSITATGQSTGSNQSAVTDVNGCVVFSGLPGLPVQSYGVTALATGYVDPNGYDAPPNVSAAVNGTGIAVPNLDPLMMGLGGRITASFTTIAYGGVQVTNVPGYYLSYLGIKGANHTSSSPLVTASPMPSPTISSLPSITTQGGAGQPNGLFPFAAMPGPDYSKNYQAWAGKCDQEQPLQPPTMAQSPGSMNYATVTPGASVPATVVEPALDVALLYNTAPVTASHVKITFTSSTGTACTDTWYPVASVRTDTITGTTYNGVYGTYPAPFASTSAPGLATSSANGQTGTDTLCADYQVSPGVYRKETWAPVANTNFTGPSAFITMDVGKDAASKSGTC